MSEIKIITSGPAQIYQDGKLLAGSSSGGTTTPPSYPANEFPAGAPPTSDQTFEMPWPHNQDKAEFTLGEYVQTVRLVVPQTVPNPGKRCWIKVYGWPGGESLLNSRMVKNNIIQRAWYPYNPPAQGLTTVLQEDFCVAKLVNDNAPEPQLWMPGDIIDYQFKSQLGIAQPVRCEVFTGEL